ncbi:iron-siderophore ABC transporter substrate-binding protein [Bacillus cereus]|uniref:Iron siderophore-binding protein n=1 Tax=Bacillus thuringiensis subsp. higo TaxID=132266 RepID=A0A9X6LP23_BACUH|nr:MULTISPECIES: iron-siderophore ABC transporter substrate-binding protein [Bacillus cereus group]MCA1003259.1 iron-siderophore ABC transporter substrate-binding protein [Bacillus thuringiensis]MDA1771025.1 iron-siderophore ABC transporter substrate-binding protein [Bacillus cereus]MDM8364654.1 iron-siderophore ABC transporter substrate-binding protein [Bacillus thuringiensis]MED2867434.1 iron-siderophore ABC transporter substrate-binding protein [Bacillus thuringiensis]MED3324409.1 iron-side
MNFMRKKSFTVFVFLLAFSLLLSACGKSNNKEESTKEDNKKEVINVEHAMGKTEVPANPKRVVILTNEGTEALLELGVKPVGAVKSWTGDPWYPHIKDKMKDVKVVGDEGQVNVETIASLKPDLIIGNKMRHEKVYEQLKAIAPTVFSETLRGEWKDNFKFYAKALNKEKEGQKVISDYESRMKDLKGKLGDKVNQEISMVRFMPGDVRIYHGDTFSGVILKELGFKRPGDQNKDDFAERNVSKERISAMDGDVLFYFTFDKGNEKKGSELEKEYINDPLFKNLNAVKNGKAYKVDDVIWNTAGGVMAANLLLDDIEKRFVK